MKNSLRVVIDTNVIVSALFDRASTPRKAYDHVTDHGVLLASLETVQEVVRVLHRPKLARYINVSERAVFLRILLEQAELVHPTESVDVCRDPRDNMFLGLAVSGRATWLVTGDDDLLALGTFRETAIVTPAEFLVQVAS